MHEGFPAGRFLPALRRVRQRAGINRASVAPAPSLIT